MDAVEITSIASVGVVALSSVFIPWYLRWRRRVDDLDKNELLNWNLLNRSIAKERDDLRSRLDEIDAHYVNRVKALQTEFDAQMGAARARIRDLEQEVAALRRLLGQPGAPGQPGWVSPGEP